MHRLYQPRPSAAELAGWGMEWADVAADYQIEIWPECVASFHLFSQLGTQWRCGPAGFYALDYNVLYHRLDRMNLSVDAYDAFESDIRIMEQAALEEMNKR